MADPNLTSGERVNVYRRIFLLNRSFHFITRHLEALDQAGIFKPRDIKEMLGLTQEVQMEINNVLLDPLSSSEADDWAQFGKVRIAMEKRLKRP